MGKNDYCQYLENIKRYALIRELNELCTSLNYFDSYDIEAWEKFQLKISQTA